MTKYLRLFIRIFLALLFISLVARFELTITAADVPITLQSLAVLMVGGLMRKWEGVIAVALYVLLGAAGLPIYSGGASGWHHLGSYSGGYLVGFIAAAAVIVFWQKRFPSVLLVIPAMLLAHAVLLLCGFAWLAVLTDPVAAWVRGVEPFIPGALAKAVAAGILVMLIVSARLFSNKWKSF